MKPAASAAAALGAIGSALASLSCCLPLGFAAALGAGAAGAFLTTLRPWLLGLSVALLGVGFWQQRRARQCRDPGHLVTGEVSRAASRQSGLPGPSCCIRHGFHWDEAILYPPGPRWSDAPAPAVWDGPVAAIVPLLEQALGDERR